MKLLISDSAEVTIKRKSDGHVFATAEAQLAGISQTLGINETIYGGIGSKPLARVRGQKEITATVRNAFLDIELLSATQGVAVKKDGTATIYKRENQLKAVSDGGQLQVTIEGAPIDDKVHLVNPQGDVVEVIAEGQTVSVPSEFAKEGDLLSAIYQEDVTGEIVEIRADKFSEAYTMEFHTIGYDPNTNQVVRDIYIQLDHVIPSADFELNFENGTPIAPEITFDCMAAPNTENIGRIITVPRK